MEQMRRQRKMEEVVASWFMQTNRRNLAGQNPDAMKRSLPRTFSQSTLNLLPSLRSKLNPPCRVPRTLSSLSSLNPGRLFSSKTPDPSESNLGQSQNKDDNKDGDISNEELRKQMDRLAEGDEQVFEEAFPTVFQAVMRRMLAGKSHEEIREELSIGRGHDDIESDSE